MSKFSGFRKFRLGKTLEEVIDYLQTGLSQSLAELQSGLQNLSFQDNFQSFETTIVIPALTELKIINKLPVIPTKRLLVRSTSDKICDGSTPWTQTELYLKNNDVMDATVTVVFLR